MIKRDYIIYETESDRPDQTSFLGEPLSIREEQVFNTIHNGTKIGPVSRKEVAAQLGLDPEKPDYISLLVGRLRRKLGIKAILVDDEGGYISSRRMIELRSGKETRR